MTFTACTVITCRGPSLQIIDDVLLATPTRPIEDDHLARLCRELQILAAQDRVRR